MEVLASEKELEEIFRQRLAEARWKCLPQRNNHTNHHRIDVVAYHDIFKTWFGFELKYPQKLLDYTLALKQLIRYRNQHDWKVPLRVFSLITPQGHPDSNIDMTIERFFWRWGFGYGKFKTMSVAFCNGESKAQINLANPAYCYYTASDHIKHILKRVDNGWESYDDEY